jgi:hypothetical protein
MRRIALGDDDELRLASSVIDKEQRQRARACPIFSGCSARRSKPKAEKPAFENLHVKMSWITP